MDQRGLRLMAWPLTALAVAGGTGAFVAAGVFTVLEPDSWRSAAAEGSAAVSVELMGDLLLLTMIMGASVLAGAMVALIMWIVGLGWAVHKAFPVGRRLVPAALTVLAAVVLSAVVLTMAAVLRDATSGAGPDLLGVVVPVVACCAVACGVFPWWAGRGGVTTAPPARELTGARPSS